MIDFLWHLLGVAVVSEALAFGLTANVFIRFHEWAARQSPYLGKLVTCADCAGFWFALLAASGLALVTSLTFLAWFVTWLGGWRLGCLMNSLQERAKP